MSNLAGDVLGISLGKPRIPAQFWVIKTAIAAKKYSVWVAEGEPVAKYYEQWVHP